jgi:Ran GTPase-activating protein (RanGAP) involved in mRNA processing and transport
VAVLQELDMSENHMGGTEGSLCRDRLASYITVKGSRLTSLNLQANRLTDQDATVLCEALGQNFKLTSVDLSHNALGDKAGMALAQLFQSNFTLKELLVGCAGLALALSSGLCMCV